MRIWSTLKRLSIPQLFRLASVALQKPLLINPTLKATKSTMAICNTLYGTIHHGNGKENAFRHALWNILICQNTYSSTKSELKSVKWAKKITDLHEKLAPNKPLEEAMDLHNNRKGREYFEELKSSSEEEIIAFLSAKTEKAEKIMMLKEIENKNELVYLS
ncbi:DUF6973 domain-containing protein [Aquimarina sp. 2201CG5-10]|uniref:DUF6973 domain-containing protein n=1 Tax=Aquimarina callyspongiae TaxID=3098150 RepID=UPI002AB3E65D|nr:hypothetical protein [Aquimarina sp. 2201CG5-10]MDY8137140.1 hypothetical protein [Aquimarina sp. 2201CG5-10]